MDSVFDLLRLRHLDEEQTMPAVRGVDHAFLVAGLVRIGRVLPVVQHGLPPAGQGICVGAVHRGVRYVGGHREMISRQGRTGEPVYGEARTIGADRSIPSMIRSGSVFLRSSRPPPEEGRSGRLPAV